MKKKTHLLLTAVFVFTLFQAAAQAQVRRSPQPTRPRTADSYDNSYGNIIKINPLSLFAATGSFAYERVISEQMSGQLGVQFTRYSGWVTGGRPLRGYAITPEFRYYFTDVAPKGFYVAPFLRYRHTSLEGEIALQGRQFEGTVEISNFGGGVLIGGQFILGERVSLEGFFGPTVTGRSYKFTEGTTESDYDIPNFFSPIWVRTGVTVGCLF